MKDKAKKKAKKKDWKERQTVYARMLTKGNEPVLQYWFFYVYNTADWGGCVAGIANEHEGDWEMIQIVLGANDLVGRYMQPLLITYSFHHSGQRRLWSDAQWDGNHPLVYITLGGHGCWYTPGDHPWMQEIKTCVNCTDKTDNDGDVLHPATMSVSEIDKIEASGKKYAYAIEYMTDWTEKNKDWIYWEGYWGKQTDKKLNNGKDRGKDGPASPPYIDYITDDNIGGRWEEPILWSNSPEPSSYSVCGTGNIKVIAHDIEGNVFNLNLLNSDSGDTVGILYSEKDMVFDVYSLDGEEVTLKISRYNRDTNEVQEVEFDWLEIPKGGKATLKFSPKKNPDFEIMVDNNLDNVIDRIVMPDYSTQYQR